MSGLLIQWSRILVCMLFLQGLFARQGCSDDLIQGGVTFDHTAGRFGDCLLHYLRAKWFAYHYQMPLLYQANEDFPYFRELVLDDEEIHLGPLHPKTKIVDIHYNCPEPKERLRHLYRIPYFPETYWELNVQGRPWFSFQVDWKDPEFQKIARKMIAPKQKLQLIEPPVRTINIALHIREGGGVDAPEVRFANPIKLPPMSYYQEAFEKVLRIFKGKPLSCYIFTDAQEPEKIVREIQESISPQESIDFHYRKEGNRHDVNVLEDFFSLFHFDVLIRPGSNFSLVPQLIHEYAVVCSPEDCTVHDTPSGKVATIDRIDVVLNEEELQKALQRVSESL